MRIPFLAVGVFTIIATLLISETSQEPQRSSHRLRPSRPPITNTNTNAVTVTTPTPEPSSTGKSRLSSNPSSSSSASLSPLARLRRPSRRTTPVPVSTTLSESAQGPNQVSPTAGPNQAESTTPASFPPEHASAGNRQEMIAKLCHRKYGSNSNVTATHAQASGKSASVISPTLKPTTSTSTSTLASASIVTDSDSVPRNPLRRSRARIPRRVKQPEESADYQDYQDQVERKAPVPAPVTRQRARPKPQQYLRSVVRPSGPSNTLLNAPAPSSTATPTAKPTSATSTSTARTPTRRTITKAAARTATKTATLAPTPILPEKNVSVSTSDAKSNAKVCPDFDHLTDEQLAKRLKGGGRRKKAQ